MNDEAVRALDLPTVGLLDPIEQPHQPPLRLGVAGCGRVFERSHLPAIERGGQWSLVGACDPLWERRAWVARRCPGIAVFESLDALLGAGVLDALLVASSPASHAQLAIQALRHGVNVLVEKPMALTLAEAAAMFGAARQTRRQLWVGFNRRCCRPYRRLRDRLAELPGRPVRAVYSEFLSGTGRWDAIGRHLGQEALGGGILDDIGSHQVDLLTWLVGRPALEARVQYHARDEPGASAVRFQLRFEGGLVAHCRAAHAASFRESVAVALDDRILWADSVGLIESRGLSLNGLRTLYEPRALAASGLRRLTGNPSELARGFEAQLGAFAAAVRAGHSREDAADAASGARVMQVIQACRESRDDGGGSRQIGPALEPTE